MKTRCVYVVGSGVGLVKVGLAISPWDRFIILRVGSPVPLTLEFIGKFEFSGALRIEHEVHSRMHGCRSHGEWFASSVEETIGVITHAASDFGLAMERIPVPVSRKFVRLPEELRGRKPFPLAITSEMSDRINEYRESGPNKLTRVQAIRELLTGALTEMRRSQMISSKRVAPAIGDDHANASLSASPDAAPYVASSQGRS